MKVLKENSNVVSTGLPPLGGIEGGFSKLDRIGRIEKLEQALEMKLHHELDLFLHDNPEFQGIFSELSENYLSNYILPFGVVPNVLIDGELFMVPMVIEESSVVAAASKASKFWGENGGFHTEIKGTEKKGQVHFIWKGDSGELINSFSQFKSRLLADTSSISEKMKERGGGITDIQLIDQTDAIQGYYQLDVSFGTANAMGANFINSCLELMACTLAKTYSHEKVEVVMSILSNYTPNCVVKCWVECHVEKLSTISGTYSPTEFARRFGLAVQMANVNVSRAVTHNKGIYNGVDAVILATGNDWRAVEAAGHAYASRNGSYQSLSTVSVADGQFKYELEIPLAIGTTGGLTQTHPLAKLAMKMLGTPSAEKLMGIVAAMGMANNFSAITSLVTSGIQKGHMKMHLSNILNQLGASEEQKKTAKTYFHNKTVSFSDVEKYLKQNGN